MRLQCDTMPVKDTGVACVCSTQLTMQCTCQQLAVPAIDDCQERARKPAGRHTSCVTALLCQNVRRIHHRCDMYVHACHMLSFRCRINPEDEVFADPADLDLDLLGGMDLPQPVPTGSDRSRDQTSSQQHKQTTESGGTSIGAGPGAHQGTGP